MDINKGIITTHTPAQPKKRLRSAGSIHTSNQKSKALNRKFVKNPIKSIDGMTVAKNHTPSASFARPNGAVKSTNSTRLAASPAKNSAINIAKKPIIQPTVATKPIKSPVKDLKPQATIIKKTTIHSRSVQALDGSGRSEVDTARITDTRTMLNGAVSSRQTATLHRKTQAVVQPTSRVTPSKPAPILQSQIQHTHLQHTVAQSNYQPTGAQLNQPQSQPTSTYSSSNILHKNKSPDQLYVANFSPVSNQTHSQAQGASTSHNDIDTHIEHPIAKTAHIRQAERAGSRRHDQAPVLKTARQIKEETINEALANAPDHNKKQVKPPTLWGKAKLIGGLSAGLVSAFALAYTAYTYMPSLSMGMVNAQAGVQASYPGYTPGGYKIDGPITGQDGRVQINFKSTTNDTRFKLIQVSSDWDSEALLSNYVKSTSKNNYQTDTRNGITVYTYSQGAAWVNGGILHIIEGTAQLNPEQVLQMAASL